MRLIGYKNFIVALLLLVFIGQSIVALTVVRQLEFRQPESQNPSSMMLNMDHSIMGMDHSTSNSKSISNGKDLDCCKTMGHCFSGSCFLASLEQNVFLLPFVLGLAITYFTVGAQPVRLIASLYRPPICR